MKKKQKYIKFSIVNLITFSRIIGSIVLPIIYFTRGIKWLGFFVAVLFLTDMIDGKLSRLWKVESFLGGLLDSISDKLFAFVMIAILFYEYPGIIVVLILEFVITTINTLAFSENKNVQSSRMGKFKTVVLDVSISIMYLYLGRSVYERFIPWKLNSLLIRSQYPACYMLIGIMVGMQLLTIYGYSKNRIKQVTYEKLDGKLKSFKEIWKMLIDREFYIENKDEPLKKFLYNQEKDV